VYSLDNLAQGQIDRSPRKAGEGHINLSSESLALRRRRGREAGCGAPDPRPLPADQRRCGPGIRGRGECV